MQKKAEEQSKRQIRNDPNRPDAGGGNQPPGQGDTPGNNRRDRRKRKRK